MTRLLLTLPPLLLAAGVARAEPRPNVLWIVVDDMSANLSCYGETSITTPHLDRLAAEGVRYTRAFVTAPVCSPCRSALITGMYQTTIGAHHHRSGRGELKLRLPEGVEPLPALFQRAGYYTCIGDGRAEGKRQAKTDYNFEWDPAHYHGRDWSGRAPGQPFFAQVQLPGGKLRDGQGWRKLAEAFGARATRPEAVRGLPPYYPPDPEILRDWAAYLDAVRQTDAAVGRVLDRLRTEGLLEQTLVVFLTDHGISHARGKQFLYDEGTHVPLLLRGPGLPAGAVRDELVEHIDVAALSLGFAGLPLPAAMQGRNLLAPDHTPREAVFAARDRCDETVDRLRSVRTADYLYIRNFHPLRPHLQPNRYKDHKPGVRRLHELHTAGALPELSTRLLFAPVRPPEELYRWQEDRWQVTNLVGEPAHQTALQDLRGRLDRWMVETRDPGAEAPAHYESEMGAYLGPRPDPEVQRNIALMKRWAAEGK
jgi:arylsulfatase A-like enzyme